MLFSKLGKVISLNATKFLVANVLYSISTALITFLSPSFLPNEVYEDFIYLYQMTLFLIGVFTIGLVPGLLRFYKLDKTRYTFYYYLTILIIVLILLLLGCFPQNFLSNSLKISTDSLSNSLIQYCGVIFSLFFIFNRGVETAKSNYNTIFIASLIIFVARLIMLYCIKLCNIDNPYYILFLLCVLPFTYEMISFIRGVVKQKICGLNGYAEFLGFILKVSIVGIIFSSTSRLYIIDSKTSDPSLAAALSFAAGLTGIISILNTTLSSYFIGTLDHRNSDNINDYINKVKRYFLPFLLITFLLGIVIFFFVSYIYPENTIQAAILSSITVIHCAFIFYIGLITLLTKTYNKLNIQILINIITFVMVWFFVRFISKDLSPYLNYILINGIILLMELILAFIILRQIKSMNINKSRFDNLSNI